MKSYDVTWLERRKVKVYGNTPQEALEQFYKVGDHLSSDLLDANVVRVHKSKNRKGR